MVRCIWMGLIQALRALFGWGVGRDRVESALPPAPAEAGATHLVVFLHGLGSDSAACWQRFPELLRTDASLPGLRVEAIDYPSALLSPGRLPRLRELAGAVESQLARWLAEGSYSRLSLIAHSQGGLLARHALLERLKVQAQDPGAPRPLLSLLSFATPHWGAYSSRLGSWVAAASPQGGDLAHDAEAILDLNRRWAEADAEAHIGMHTVVAGDDAIVPVFSALNANFAGRYHLVPGHGHGSIVKTDDRGHPSYEIARRFLCEAPVLHPEMRAADLMPPPLRLGLLAEDQVQGGVQRLLFLARWVPMKGREDALRALTDFLHQARRADGQPMANPVAWLSLIGSGGVGKSRLALELCLSLQEAGWHAGFLDREARTRTHWARWQPRLPTLLVLDYATADPERLRAVLQGLCQRDPEHALRHPVRLLLLDRPDQQQLLDQAIGHTALAEHVRNARHHPQGASGPELLLESVHEPLELFHAHWDRLYPGQPRPDEAEVRAALRALDPHQRPLYVLMLAETLGQGFRPGASHKPAEMRREVLRHVLDRESSLFWQPAARDADLTVHDLVAWLALATAAGGLSRAALETPQAPRPPWSNLARNALARASAYDKASARLAALQPDLLGEHLVLTHVAEMDEPDRAPWLAWVLHQAPGDAAAFLSRVTQDFPEDLTLSHQAEPVAARLRTEHAARAFAEWAFAHTPIQPLHACALSMHQVLREVRIAWPDQAHVRLAWAASVVNLVADMGRQDLKVAEGQYRELAQLAQEYAREPWVREAQAQAAVNLIDTVALPDSTRAETLLGELAQMTGEHGGEPALREAQAKATVNLMHVVVPQDWTRAECLYRQLAQLVWNYPDEPALRVEQAKAAVSLMYDLDPQHLFRAEGLYGELAQLVAGPASVAGLREWQAKAAVLLIHSMAPHDLMRAEGLYRELRRLAVSYPREPRLREWQAKAALNLMPAVASQNLARAEGLYRELVQLAGSHAAEPVLREAQAQAVFNLISAVAPHDLACAEYLYRELAQLSREHVSEPVLQEAQFEAAFNVISCMLTEDITRAEGLRQELGMVCTTRPSTTPQPDFVVQCAQNRGIASRYRPSASQKRRWAPCARFPGALIPATPTASGAPSIRWTAPTA